MSVETANSKPRPGFDYPAVSCAFVCHDGERVLLHRRGAGCRDERGTWDSGAGMLEVGETFEEAVAREVREEYGAYAQEIRQLGVRNILREREGALTHWVCALFTVRVDPLEVKICEPMKMEALGWFALDELPQPRHSQFDAQLECYRQAGIGRDEAQVPSATVSEASDSTAAAGADSETDQIIAVVDSTESTITISFATLADVEEILAAIQSLVGELRGDPTARLPEGAASVCHHIIANPDVGAAIVARETREDGTEPLVGMVIGAYMPSIRLGDRYGFLQDFWVSPTARNQHVGTLIAECGLRELRRRGLKRLEGVFPRAAFEGHDRARRFYHGFGEVEEIGIYGRMTL